MLFMAIGWCGPLRAQHAFLVEISDRNLAPSFQKSGAYITYNGSDSDIADFFGNYNLIAFDQAFPASRTDRVLNHFKVVSTSTTLIDDIVSAFPGLFVRSVDLPNVAPELTLSYPNDYGTTSPVTNLGANVSLADRDYVNAPKAWDITYGNPNVLIGISDERIDLTDDDFDGKTTQLAGQPGTPFNLMTEWHGTYTASIAGAQGNNAHGVVGICSDCSLLSANYNYNSLLVLRNAGARIINMSWAIYTDDPINCTCADEVYQLIMDELHEDNVLLVAAAGNRNSFIWGNPGNNFMYYGFPASFNHVISVTAVNHKNDFREEEVYVDGYGNVSRFVKDMVSPSVITNYLNQGPVAFNSGKTTNDRIDICAPGYEILIYPMYVNNEPHPYGEGTSGSAPFVAGTLGLMVSLNDCLDPDEAEDVLQLTSKNLEHIQGNEPFIGRSGSGKLETGDAVEFVDEMMAGNGIAVINGQDFYRFRFDLKHINNGLVIEDQIFRDANISDFVAKNYIEILDETDLRPNEEGYIHLSVDEEIEVCDVGAISRNAISTEQQGTKASQSLQAMLFPNPNDGKFTIRMPDVIKSYEVIIYDMIGNEIHRQHAASSQIWLDMSRLATGMYIVSVRSGGYSEQLKFIRR